MTTRIQKRNKAATASLLTILMLLPGITFTGCQKESVSTPADSGYINKKAVKPVQQAEETEEPDSTTSNLADLLDFSNRKDPFKPFIATQTAVVGSGGRKQADETGNELPIHSFEVSQFRLIGTIIDSKGNRAMVVDPAGKGYVLKTGMSIGKNEGKIAGITANGVNVVELFRDENNKIRKETITIPLMRKP